MPIAQASQLCVANVLPHDPAEDLEVLQQLAEKFHDHVTPLVSIETIDKKPWAGHPRHQSESLVCDITGVAHLFGGETGLLSSVTKMLGQENLAARMAIADYEAVAWAVAHGMTEAASASIAKQAPSSATEKLPPRCTIVPTGQSEIFVQPLCVTTLRIDESTSHTLQRLGIQTIGQLLKLPRSGLAARLGSKLTDRIAALVGEVELPLTVFQVPVEHCETWTLEYPTTDQAILQDRILQLVGRVRAGLAAQQRGALRVKCCLDLAVHPPLTLQIGLFAPTNDVDHLCGLFFTRLETIRLPGDVHRLTLSVTLSGPIRSTQISLLDEGSGDQVAASQSMAGSSISRLVDSLSNRLGRDRVVKVQIQKQSLPESAYRKVSLAGNPIAIRRRAIKRRGRAIKRRGRGNRDHETVPADRFASGGHPMPTDAMRRPVSLLISPIPLAVAFDGGPFRKWVSHANPPDRLRLHNVAYQVVRCWGPERIETGWWSGPSVRRDYFRVEATHSSVANPAATHRQWWWIYRDFSCGSEQAGRYRWVLHGRFT